MFQSNNSIFHTYHILSFISDSIHCLEIKKKSNVKNLILPLVEKSNYYVCVRKNTLTWASLN